MKPLVDADCRWRSIPGYAGVYLVSDTGLIFSESRTEFVQSKRTGGHYRFRNAGVKKTRINKLGYEQIGLNLDGKVKLCLVHRLVAQAFLPNPDNLPEVNHLNGVRDDNRLENLEWSTRSQNALHGTEVLCRNRGADNALTKLSEEDVLQIKDCLEAGESQTEVAKRYNVTNHAIFRIRYGYNWSWLTGCEKKGGSYVAID